MSDTRPDRRRTCRALTDVLQRSPLAERIDPKGFYMLLSSNYAVLERPGALDLGPVWAPLHGQIGDDPRLLGLFVGFAEALRQLGLQAHLPGEVAALDPPAQLAALERTFGASADEAVIEAVPPSDFDFETDEIPSLTSQDLVPVITEELKRGVVREVVGSLKASAVGPLIDGGQLGFRLDAHFAELFDGRRFDFGPVLDGLRQIPGFTDRGAYVGILRMEQRLEGLGVALELPPLDIPEAERAALVEEAREAERRERQERRRASSAKAEAPPAAEAPPPEVPPPGGTKKEQQLRRYGLLGLSSKRWRAIRVAVLTVLVVAGAAAAWLTRPDRPLDPAAFPLPLRAAELRDGAFVGTLDDKAWYRLTEAKRNRRLAEMKRVLGSRGLSANARVLDRRGRLVMRARAGRGLEGSRFVMQSPDGVQPPPQGEPIDPSEAAAGAVPAPE